MTRRRGQHHGDLRPRPPTSALDLLEAGKEDDVTLRAVAGRAGVSPAAPYRHLPDKAALLAEVALDGFRRLGDLQAEIGAQAWPSDPAGQVEALATAYVRFAVAHRAHYAVMCEALHHPPPVPGSTAGGAATQRDQLRAATLGTFEHLAEGAGRAARAITATASPS